MSRSQKKGPYVDEKLFRKVQKAEAAGSKEPIKTWARACTVIPEFIGYTFMIHDGRKHVKVLMTEDMVGHKMGEFAPTRTFKGHGGGKRK
ncbi:MAG: 30S ribosomal protein S19 [Mariniblastus sp.]|nr:30S ribosomal protein S19 [Mariniblastus sp.]